MQVIIDTKHQKVSAFRPEQTVSNTYFGETYNVLYIDIIAKNDNDNVWEQLANNHGDIFYADLNLAYDDYGCIFPHIEIIDNDQSTFYKVRF